MDKASFTFNENWFFPDPPARIENLLYMAQKVDPSAHVDDSQYQNKVVVDKKKAPALIKVFESKGMFVSEEKRGAYKVLWGKKRANESQGLRGHVEKLANENPELRGHLVPLLKQAATQKFNPEMISKAKKLLNTMKNYGWQWGDDNLKEVSRNGEFYFSQMSPHNAPWDDEEDFKTYVPPFRAGQLFRKYKVEDHAGLVAVLHKLQEQWKKDSFKFSRVVGKITPKDADVKLLFNPDRQGTLFAQVYVNAQPYLEWTSHRAKEEK